MTDATTPRSVAYARLELMGGEDADAIADAVIKSTPNAVVEVLPGQLNISAPGRLDFECADVSDALGRPWDTRELQVILANYAGYIVRMDESGVTLSWLAEDEGDDAGTKGE